MIAYLNGKLEDINIDSVIIDVNGIGYKVFMPNTCIEKLGKIGDIVKIHTHYHVREDNISLFGFNTKEQLRVFELLLLVSGIGGKLAINIISEITPYDFSLAVISNDINVLTKVSGVGPKVAQRIILELKDRLKTETAILKDQIQVNVQLDNNNAQEAISALQVLGYNIKDIKQVFNKIENISELSIEDIIKKALVYLGR